MTDTPLGILITGAGSGLGRGLAQTLAAPGRRLFLADLHADAIHETIRSMPTEASVKATAHVLDVTSSAAVAALAQSIGHERIDVVINNAGLQHVSPLEQFAEEQWDRLID